MMTPMTSFDFPAPNGFGYFPDRLGPGRSVYERLDRESNTPVYDFRDGQIACPICDALCNGMGVTANDNHINDHVPGFGEPTHRSAYWSFRPCGHTLEVWKRVS